MKTVADDLARMLVPLALAVGMLLATLGSAAAGVQCSKAWPSGETPGIISLTINPDHVSEANAATGQSDAAGCAAPQCSSSCLGTSPCCGSIIGAHPTSLLLFARAPEQLTIVHEALLNGVTPGVGRRPPRLSV